MKTKPLTPLKAIKLHCYQCSGENKAEVRKCQIPTCPLYSYRFGKRPATVAKAQAAREARKQRAR